MKLNKTIIIFTFMLLLVTSLVSASLLTDIYTYYTFDENTSTTVHDLVRGYNGTGNGNTNWFTGLINSSIYQDGVGDYISISQNYTFDSLSFWIKPYNEITISTTANQFMYYPDLNNGIRFGGFTGNINNEIISIAIGGNSNIYYWNSSIISSIDTSKFHHFVLIWDDSESNYRLYYEGSDKGLATIYGSPTKLPADNFDIGKYSSTYNKGNIDEVGFWTRELTSSEVTELYNSGDGFQYSFNEYVPEYFDITAVDSRDNSSLTTFNATFDDLTGLPNSTALNYADGESHYYTRTHTNYSIEYNGSNITYPYACLNDFYPNRIYLSEQNGKLQCVEWISAVTGTTYSFTDYDFGDNFNLWGSTERYFYTTNGTINTGLNSTSGLINLTIQAENYYTETETNYNTSTDLEVSFDRTKYNVTFTAEQIYSSDTITPFNITLENGTTILNTDTPYEIYSDYTIFNFSKTGYYNYSLTNQTIINDTTITFNNMYNAVLNLTFKDVLTNNTINKTGYFIFDGNNISTTNGTFSIPMIRNNYVNTTSKAENYAFQYNDLNITDYFTEGTYYLYSQNSVWVTAKDLSSLTTLTNITVTIYNSFNIYTQTNDTVRINNITGGTYNVKVEKPEYSTTYYIITVGEGSHQDLEAYLSKDTVAITFTTQNLQNGGILEGVTSSIYYLINTSWVLINSKDSDVTGRLQFNVDTSNNYRFSFSKTGFTTKTFLLEPVFTEYTIKLVPTDYAIPTTDQGDYYVEVNPSLVFGNQLNNISFNIVSGSGSLEYYNVTVNARTDTKSGNYSNTYGGSYVYEINATTTEIIDTINVTYGVKEVGESYKVYTVLLPIQNGATYNDNTLFGFKTNTSTLGYFEKGIIATIIMLILLGIIASVSQMTGGNTFVLTGSALLILSSLFVIIDFLPSWTLYLTGFTFILVIFSKLRGE